MSSRFGGMKAQREAKQAAQPMAPAAPATAEVVRAAPGKQASRAGKKAVVGYYSPELSRALNMLAVEQDKTIQALLGEGIDLLLRQYGKHPFGES